MLRGQLTAQHGDGAASEEERGTGRMLADEVRGHVGHTSQSPEGQVRTVAVTPGKMQNHKWTLSRRVTRPGLFS